MNRRKFLGITGGAIASIAAGGYLLSDKSNISRADIKAADDKSTILKPEEREILFLASLAPSGHNTQPWFVQYVEPYHWIVGNDQSKWLPAVDPNQRETVLSIGTFVQNLELAAGAYGYACNWNLLAETNQDERVLEVKLTMKEAKNNFDIANIKDRRTVRSGYLGDVLKREDAELLIGPESDFIHYLPFTSKESQYIDEQTIEANRIQAYRDPAQQELADWIRFSGSEAEKYRDGLTTASMEIEGIAGWVVRNFYGKDAVMKADFREQGLGKVRDQVARSAGWIVLTSKDESVESLLETGRRMQRLFLKVREMNIAIHPMTQILEEPQSKQDLNRSIGINESIQFLLRVGYLKNYPSPVSLRRPVAWFVRTTE
jgi:nitroreductase